MSTEQLNSLLSEYGHLMYSAGMDSASPFLERRRTGVETEAKAQGIRARLLVELEARGKDAERYRWLRNRGDGWYVGPSYTTHNDVVCEGEYLDLSGGGAALDSAIDTALSKGAQEGVKA